MPYSLYPGIERERYITPWRNERQSALAYSRS